MTLNPEKRKSPKDWIGLQVRLREELREKLHATAAAKGVSMNSELIDLLEKALDLGGGLSDSGMVNLWRDIYRIIQSMEALTGESWLEDRTTFVAVKSLLTARLEDLAPPLVNQAEILARNAQRTQNNNKMQALIEILVDSGAIAKESDQHREFTTARMLECKTVEAREIWGALEDLGYQPLVNLVDDPDTWMLMQEGRPSSERGFAVGIKALLLQLAKLKKQSRLLRKESIKAFEPNKAAEKAGKILAAQFRIPRDDEDDRAIEGVQ